jgi:hypothetical protein
MTGSAAHDEGYYHLGPQGWSRKDARPFPESRVETWRYEMDQPSPHAKQQIHLTRVWVALNAAEPARQTLHHQFGEAIVPATEKSIIVQCRV